MRIAGQDRPMLEEAMPQLTAEFAHLKHIHLVDDASVAPGGCIVVYGQGQIDATIDTQLHRVVEFMLPGEPEAAPTTPPANPRQPPSSKSETPK